MGLPARKIEPQRPKLRAVEPRRSPRVACSRSATANVAYCRARYRAFLTLALLVSVLSVGRVALSAAATDVSMRSSELRSEIKAARYEGDMLEVQRSALGAPGRIRNLAGRRLDMAEARSVCYIRLDGEKSDAPVKSSAKSGKASSAKALQARVGSKSASKTGQGGVKGFVSDVMDAAAGEAQVLLVGDVGIAASR
jgi:cell division protein FtsL